MDLPARHWLIALVCAVGAHLFLVALFNRPAGPSALVDGILIELGDGGTTGDSPPEPEGPKAPSASHSANPEPLVPEPIEPAWDSQVQAEKPEAPEPNTPVEPTLLAEAVPASAKEQVIEDTPESARPISAARPKAKPRKRKQAPSAKSRKKSPKARHPGKIAQSATGGTTGGRTGGRAGRSSGADTTALAAAKSYYAGLISDWLNRNKRYPKRARRLGHQGLVTVRFTLDRNGRVLSSSIVRSSGHETLDGEVRALMRRGRMPRMPAEIKQTRVTMTVPIRFRLR